MPESVLVGSSRLLAMASWIASQPRQSTTVGQLADHFTRTVKQVERDLDQLTYFRDSLPLESFELVWTPAAKGTREALRRQNPVRVLQSHGASLPSVFTTEIAAQAIIRLRAMAPALPAELANYLPATVMAIQSMTPGTIELARSIDDATQSSSDFLPLLNTAVATHTVVEMEYVKPHGAATRRLVEPCAVRRAPHDWHLHGLDRSVGEHRHFAVSRIHAVSLREETFTAHQQCPGDDSPRIRVGLRPHAMWLVDDFAEFVEKRTDEFGLEVIVADIPVWNSHAVRDLLVGAGSAVVFIDDVEMEDSVRRHATSAYKVWSHVLASVGDLSL